MLNLFTDTGIHRSVEGPPGAKSAQLNTATFVRNVRQLLKRLRHLRSIGVGRINLRKLKHLTCFSE